MLIDHLPDVLRKIREFSVICGVDGSELSALKEELSSAVGDCFIASLGAKGCARWEKMLGLFPDADDTLEDRRFRISAALDQGMPYTLRWLKMRLNQLCGENGYSLELYPAKYAVTVRIGLEAKAQFDAVSLLLANVIPANMKTTAILKYNKHGLLSALTHRELAQYKHHSLRESVLYYSRYAQTAAFSHGELTAYSHEQLRSLGLALQTNERLNAYTHGGLNGKTNYTIRSEVTYDQDDKF